MKYSSFFHNLSKDHHIGHPTINPDPENWPEEWKNTYFKTYPRLPKVDLVNTPPNIDLFEAVHNRVSLRNFQNRPLSLWEVSILLKHGTGIVSETNQTRAYPSAGQRYPVEIYPIIFCSTDELKSGIYHYNVATNQLDILSVRVFSKEERDSLFLYPWAKNAWGALIFTAYFPRVQNKYGERGYRYALLEAGHIMQNVYLICEALGLQCCALGGTQDANIETLLDIDGVTESVIYAAVIGK